jgi:hypothetical protein
LFDNDTIKKQNFRNPIFLWYNIMQLKMLKIKKLSKYFGASLLTMMLIGGCSPKIGAPKKIVFPERVKNILIDESTGSTGPCEPTIYISPNTPGFIAAGAILDRAYVSTDYGRNWKKIKLKSPYGVYGDPVVVIDKKDNIFFAHLSNPLGKAYTSEEFLDRIVVQKSSDRGQSWNGGTYPPVDHKKDHDKHWMAIDPFTNNLLMSWTEFDKYGSKDPDCRSRILFSLSKDEGESWTQPIVISQLEGDCIDGDDTTEGAVPCIGIDGTYYVAWSYAEKIYLDISNDKGKTWLMQDIEVADQPGGWTFDVSGVGRVNGMPIIKADHSKGPNRGTLYINFSDQRNGTNNTDVWLVKSMDNGQTWSKPIKVNDNQNVSHQYFTWMDVDPSTGYIYIVFYDRREQKGSDYTDVYIAVSTDGGQSFQNKKISESPFLQEKSVFFGDYNNISAFDGIVRPIWTRQDGRKLSVWTAILDFGKVKK